jgi:hypothetical protein
MLRRKVPRKVSDHIIRKSGHWLGRFHAHTQSSVANASHPVPIHQPSLSSSPTASLISPKKGRKVTMQVTNQKKARNGRVEFLVLLLSDPSLKNNDPHENYRDTP